VKVEKTNQLVKPSKEKSCSGVTVVIGMYVCLEGEDVSLRSCRDRKERQEVTDVSTELQSFEENCSQISLEVNEVEMGRITYR
jgi:hypothetical protein